MSRLRLRATGRRWSRARHGMPRPGRRRSRTTTPGPVVSRPVTCERSKISTPRSSHTRASSAAMRAGCTMPHACFSHTRGEIRGGVDGCLRLGLVEIDDALLALGGPFLEPLDLVGLDGGRELAGALELEVHAVACLGGLDRVEVLAPEPVEDRHLVGPPGHAVLVAVREARLAEAAVAARRRPADALRLDDHDLRRGVALGGEQRGPQAGVAAADDDEVGAMRADQRRPVGEEALGEVVAPEHRVPGVGEGMLDDGCCRPLSFEHGRAHGYQLRCGVWCSHPRRFGAAPQTPPVGT